MPIYRKCNECGKKILQGTLCECEIIKKKNRYKKYKSNRNDIKEQRFYTTKAWLITRESIKARDKGLCRLCLTKNNITYMNTVHHIQELKDCWDKRLDPNNLISLCESCHQLIHKGYKTNKLDIQRMLKNLIEG